MRPGYELWRPNREKAGSVTTKFVVVLLLAATAVRRGAVTIGGWSLLKGGGGMGIVCAIYAILYAFFAFLVARWNRGILPVAAALSMILAIFCAVGAESWFNRDRAGFDEALLPSSLIGLLVIVLGLLQIVLIAGLALRLQPGVARRGGAPDRLRRGLRRRRLRPPATRLIRLYGSGRAGVAELAYAIDSKSIALAGLWVRIPPPASSERG